MLRFSRLVVAVGAIAFLIVMSGCSRSDGDQTPKARLRAYLQKSFDIRRVEERRELESFLSGGTRAKLAAWSDEQFRQAFIVKERKFLDLSFRDEKKISDKEHAITYELSYQDNSRKNPAKITHRKVAQMEYEGGTWYIRQVRNVKELIVYENEMSLP